ncbi:MAG: PAS domain S-box protein [Acidobacteriota bacterium]
MKVLYVKGTSVEIDESTLQQLRTQAPELGVTVAVSSAAALAEVRRAGGWHAVLVSPALPQNETLAIIASLRRDRVPIAIVPIVDDAHQDVFAAAVASGADDVLMRRSQALVNVTETLTRIRQSPHLFPAEQRRRLTVLYAGRDTLVWNLLEQVPFVDGERVTVGVDGSCPVRAPGVTDGSLRCDAVVIDEQPGDAHPLQVLKSVKAQASDLPVIVLTSTGASDIATAALELGADDTVVKTGIFRRRLIAALRRVHLRLELTSQQAETKAREERLRLIVENVPTGISVIAGDAIVLAMNAAALQVFGATKPRDVVGRDLRQLVAPEHHDAVVDFVHRVTRGESTSMTFTAVGLDGRSVGVLLQGVMLERDARGGRGIVASVSLASGGVPLGGVSTTGELAELRDAIPRLEQQQIDLQQSRDRERSEWDAERDVFVRRLDAAEHAANEQQARSERLETLAADLTRAREALAAERTQLETRVRELEQTSHDAGAAHEARTAAEGELQTLRARLHEAVSSGESAQHEWQAARLALEARLREIENERSTHAEQASALPAVRADVDALRLALDTERAGAAGRLSQLEAELRLAREALWAEHRERDEDRARFTGELRTIRDALTSERTEWEQHRADTAAERDAAYERAATREREISALQAERDADRERALGTFDGERHDWQTTRERIEADTRAVQERSAALEGDIARLRAELEDARSHAGTSEHDRAAWSEERTALEARLRSADEAAEQLRRDQDTQVQDVRAQASQAGERAAAAERDLQALRDQLAQARQHEDDLRNEQAAHADTRDSFESQFAAHVAQVQQATHRAGAAEGELESIRQSLVDQQAQAENNRRALEAEVHAAREAAEAVSADRAARSAELEGLLRDASARAEHLERELNALRGALAEADEITARHTAERLEWEGTRAHLESAVEAARAAHDAGRQIWDSLRSGLEEDLHRTREQLADGQNEWQAHRAALDNERRQAVERAETAERERDALRAELADAHRQASDVRATAEGAWQSERTALESILQQARDRIGQLEHEHHATQSELSGLLDSERQTWAAVRGRLEGEHESAQEQLRTKQQEWDAQRASFEGLLKHAHDDVESLQRELDATQAQLERDREDTKRAADRERGEWEQARASGEREIETLRATITSLEHDLGTRVSALSSALQSAEAKVAASETIQTALDAARSEIRHTDDQHAAERAEWQSARAALEAAHADLARQLTAEREGWSQERANIDVQLREVAAVRSHHQQLDDSLNGLRTDYAAMVQALTIERDGRGEDRRDLETLRGTLAAHNADREQLRQQLADATHRADARAAEREAEHAARLRALEDELVSAAQRLTRVTDDAERARASLQTEYLRASESHTRLTASDMFAYAVTTVPGELVRCNDTFARLLGFADAPDALTRTAGRLFPGLSGREQVMARLLAAGHIDRIESCLERADGQAVRIIESATLITDGEQPDDEAMVEHVMIGAVAAPDRDELRARQLEEIGALTSAMIPEIETLASTVHERGHDLRRQLRDGHGGVADAEGMLTLTANINALVRQLAAFSRRHLREADAVDLAEAIARTEPVLVRLVGDFIAFSMHLSPAPPVIVDPEDLDQLLTSLVTFGRDLLPAGGSLTVEVLPPAGAARPGEPAGSSGSTLLAVTASGYGVQLPPDAPALELVARRCGATLKLSGEPGWMARLDVHFPRCGRPQRSGWTWSTE